MNMIDDPRLRDHISRYTASLALVRINLRRGDTKGARRLLDLARSQADQTLGDLDAEIRKLEAGGHQ